MKKIIVYLLVGILTFSMVFSNYYKSAHAMEWASGALSFSEVLTWLLASVGITCTISDYASEVDKSRAEFWEEYEEKFYNDVEEHYGVDTNDIKFRNWIKKLCEGTLDKSSEYWDIFKEWALSLVSGTTVSDSFDYAKPLPDVCDYLSSKYGMTWLKGLSNYSSISGYNVKGFILAKYSDSYDYYTYLYLFEEGSNIYLQNNSIKASINPIRATYIQGYYNNRWDRVTYISIPTSDAVVTSNFWIATRDLSSLLSNYPYFAYDDYFVSSIQGTVDTNFESAFTNDIENADIISSVVPDESDQEVSIPMPGINDSDDSASADAYDEIIDAINDGTITQEEGLERIQEILKIIVYDTVTDDVLPHQEDPDTGENKKKEEVIQDNKNNMGFTLAGLENVFPFCIPFDIYAFMTLLVAEPEAPEIDFPIKSVNGEVEEIHLDLSPFDSVAVVVRYIFDFLFIIGLGILTRSLIGGGSSD